MVLHTSINIDALELSNHPTKHSRRMENQSVNHRVFKDNQYIHSLQATMTFVTSFKHPPDDLLLPNSGRLDEFVQSYHSATKLEMSLDSNSIRYKRDDPSQDDCSFHLLGPLPSSRTWAWAPGISELQLTQGIDNSVRSPLSPASIKNTLCSF